MFSLTNSNGIVVYVAKKTGYACMFHACLSQTSSKLPVKVLIHGEFVKLNLSYSFVILFGLFAGL